MAITAFLSRSPGLLNWGPGAQPLWYMFLIPASSLQLVWSPTAQSGVLRVPSARCWFSLPHFISNWLNFLCIELYNCSMLTFFLWASQIALIQPVHGQGYILIFLDRMHLLFTQMHFLFLQLGRVGGICNTSYLQPYYKLALCNLTINSEPAVCYFYTTYMCAIL